MLTCVKKSCASKKFLEFYKLESCILAIKISEMFHFFKGKFWPKEEVFWPKGEIFAQGEGFWTQGKYLPSVHRGIIVKFWPNGGFWPRGNCDPRGKFFSPREKFLTNGEVIFNQGGNFGPRGKCFCL